jgi:hypothetical protein
MPFLASLTLLHGSGPLDVLLLAGPLVGVLAVIGGVLVAPFFRGTAKLSFGSAYGLATGGLIIAGFVLLLGASLLDKGYLVETLGEWRLWIALAGAATSTITVGVAVPAVGRALRVLALVVGVLSVGFVAFIFLVGG